MDSPRTLPLFDPGANPSSWNERMAPGEYAVHYSAFKDAQTKPFCTVFPTLAEAEDHARSHVLRNPSLRCRIYDHQGFIGRPLRESAGAVYKESGEISQRFRRWIGSLFLGGGIILILIDWIHDFSLSWPAMIGVRMVFPGLLLLVTEIFLVHAQRKSERDAQPTRA